MNSKKHYDLLIAKAIGREKPFVYCESHHITPKSLGGGDDKSNLTWLTAREHFIAHLLLADIYGGPMIRALHLMSNRSKVSSRLFEKYKILFSEEQKRIGKKIGLRNWETGVGLSAWYDNLSKEEKFALHSSAGKLGGTSGGSNPSSLSAKRKSGLAARNNKTGIHAPGVASLGGKKGGEIASRKGQIQKLQSQVSSIAGSASCNKRNAIKLICDLCGFKGNSGHQGKHRKRTGCQGKGVFL